MLLYKCMIVLMDIDIFCKNLTNGVTPHLAVSSNTKSSGISLNLFVHSFIYLRTTSCALTTCQTQCLSV